MTEYVILQEQINSLFSSMDSIYEIDKIKTFILIVDQLFQYKNIFMFIGVKNKEMEYFRNKINKNYFERLFV
jgi:hypothetical protein